MFGKKTSLAGVLMLGIGAIAAILHLQDGASQSTNAQLSLAEVKVEPHALQVAPFYATPKTGGSPVLARREMDTEMATITHELAALQDGSPPKALEGSALRSTRTTRPSSRSTAWARTASAAGPTCTDT
jgi:hypothetical protein